MKLRRVISAALALAMTATMAVSASASNADLYPGTSEAGSLTIDLEMEPTSVNSTLATYVADGRIISCLVAGLTQKDADAVPQPGLAESWDVSDDGLIYTFHLRDAQWSNGTAVTSNDFAFGWKTVLDPNVASEYAYFVYDTACIKNAKEYYNGECTWEDVGVKCIDDKTLEVTLTTPIPYFLSLLEQSVLLPVNEAFYTEVGAESYFTSPETCISCGPYVMTEWVHDSNIVLVKNETYYNADAVSIQTLNWNIYTQSDTRLNAFRAGEVDVIALTGDQAKTLEAEGFEPIKYVTQSEYHILFNTEDEYLSNVNLRKAIDLCYSRNDFIKGVRQDDGSVPANTFVPSPVSGCDGTSYSEACIAAIGTDGVVRSAEADVEKANEYLDKALEELGVTKEELSAHLDMHCGDSDTAMTQAAFFQEAMRKNLGLEITITPMQTKAQSAERQAGNYVLDISGWVGDYNDPMTWYDMWVTGGGNNSVFWSNAEYDALIADALINTDTAARQEDFIKCEQLLVEECPISCIYSRAGTYAVSGKVTGNYSVNAWSFDFRFATLSE